MSSLIQPVVYREPVAHKRISVATAKKWKWMGMGATVIFNHADGKRHSRVLRLAYCLNYPSFYRTVNERAGNAVPADLEPRFYVRRNNRVYEVVP